MGRSEDNFKNIKIDFTETGYQNADYTNLAQSPVEVRCEVGNEIRGSITSGKFLV
jgi:hypothetical protein